MSNITSLLSAVAANRKAFFELVTALEQAAQCSIDEDALIEVIDADFDSRDTLTLEEAKTILMNVARKRRSPRSP